MKPLLSDSHPSIACSIHGLGEGTETLLAALSQRFLSLLGGLVLEFLSLSGRLLRLLRGLVLHLLGAVAYCLETLADLTLDLAEEPSLGLTLCLAENASARLGLYQLILRCRLVGSII